MSVDSILNHEVRTGCSDRAVVGGLDRLLDRLCSEGHEEARTIQSSLPEAGYRGMGRSSRRTWIAGVVGAASTPARRAPTATPEKEAPRPRALTAQQARAGSEPSALVVFDPNDPLATPLEQSGVQIGKRHRERLAHLGIDTVGDLLRHYPYRHHDFTRAVPIGNARLGDQQAVTGVVVQSKMIHAGKSRRPATEAEVDDGSGRMKITWFNMPFLVSILKRGVRIACVGKVAMYHGRLSMANPEFIVLDGEDASQRPLLPVYHTTQKLPVASLRGYIEEALGRFDFALDEVIPEDMRARHDLIATRDAVQHMHYPASYASRALARRTTAFSELLAVHLCIVKQKSLREEGLSAVRIDAPDTARSFVDALPFSLTDAQDRALDDVLKDMRGDRPMGRLLQGDVGSGKTVVALAAMLTAIASGRQAVLMAPTEILAEQHFRTISALLANGGQSIPGAALLSYPPHKVEIALVTGSTGSKARRHRLQQIANGQASLIVGTHALIQDDVDYQNLGLVVIDEQHRFGVLQRAALRESGSDDEPSPHLLVMTATPIPRSLALTLYGDLDLSVIDEMPPGRLPVRTAWLPPDRRDEAFQTIRDEVTAGRQAFVICPLVEGSSVVSSRAATEEVERLRNLVFPDLADRIELLHGRMRGRTKNEVMQRFASGEALILVSTAVVEVGVDVPNASVIVIEGAARFGVAQLHQFRGRVGRSDVQSHCFLLDDDPTPDGEDRLSMVERNNDGFALAQADLELRGPGDLFGVEQSGRGALHAASLLDGRLIEAAREEAEELLSIDPNLGLPEHAALRMLANRAASGIVAESH